MKEKIIEKTLEFLDTNKIEYKYQEHEAVFTVDDIKRVGLKIDGIGIKTLFLRDRKGERFYLVALNDQKRLDLKKLALKLEEKKLSFATEENLDNFLKVKSGSVTPLALIFNEQKNVKLILDKDIFEAEKINMHPNKNTATVTFDNNNFKKLLNILSEDYKLFEL